MRSKAIETEEYDHAFFITGLVPSKKNSKMITRGRLITNPATQERLKGLTTEIRLVHWRKRPKLTHATVEVQFHVSSMRSDLDNGLSTLVDCLKNSGVIVNDSMAHVRKVAATFALVKKGHEGADIILSGKVAGTVTRRAVNPKQKRATNGGKFEK